MKTFTSACLASVSALSILAGSAHAVTPPGFAQSADPDAAQALDGQPRSNQFWWPNTLDLSELRSNAYSSELEQDAAEYRARFEALDLEAVKSDIAQTLTTSQDWWPADYGAYIGLMIRLAWHSAGTYRVGDGRGGSDGGQIRFDPLRSWPDNGNLDKARRLLWPVKEKYGDALSWSDLIILSGNVSLEMAGFETLGFAGGRVDHWEPEMVYWGAETQFLSGSERYDENGEMEEPLAASEIGLIYVNPEGPGGNPDIMGAAQEIRTTFSRMGMDAEGTVALIVGGHTLGKAHGARPAADCVGPEPAAEGVAAQGMGWSNRCGTGAGPDTTTSGLEGAWTGTPIAWSNNYVENLYNFEWVQTESPAGAIQWVPENADEVRFVPDAHDPDTFHPPVMQTTDLALRYDPEYGEITRRWFENPGEMDAAFAEAWFQLTHRDLGPLDRYAGSEVPEETFIWQDPLPEADYEQIDAEDIERLEAMIRDTDLTPSEMVRTAWASASTFRDTDMRGGANGARIRFAPQNGWDVNDAEELERVLGVLEGIQSDFNGNGLMNRLRGNQTRVSLADLIVLAGGVGIEDAAAAAGHEVEVPFTPGRVDALEEQTDVASFEYLNPAADGFRNYYSDRARLEPAAMLVDRADTLTLTVPEMTVLVGGMRALDANAGGAEHGVLTDTPGELSNDFFTNLLDLSTRWAESETEEGVYIGTDVSSGETRWTATEVDLIFGSNPELRAVAEHYAVTGAEERFVNDFVAAWVKVMELDRFDLDNA
ncbi:catalase/peroxidase HPI [Oceanicaulis sp. MMSF_3324]|uniref:catalase/peroxidase HPI n=1 Tax=Oceanicaulis sp. MMSF_3324 TaxID=3046702 RepID=UPI00273E2BFE|nr:catalase/peroxidase HPI [Oceanicaulis sp. MMSF_3324]